MTLAGFQERQRIADLLSSDAKESILADVRSGFTCDRQVVLRVCRSTHLLSGIFHPTTAR